MLIPAEKDPKKYPSDQVLLPQYLQGADDPVGTWIDQKYFSELWLTASYWLNHDKHRAVDAMHDVAYLLCKYESATRPFKFVKEAIQVRYALRRRVRNRSIDISRKYAPVSYDQEEMGISIPAEIESLLAAQEERKLLEAYYQKKGYYEDWFVVELIIEYNREAKKILMAEYGFEDKAAHNILTKNRTRLNIYGMQRKKNP